MRRILMSQGHHDNNLTNKNIAFAQYTEVSRKFLSILHNTCHS